jgi:hypothetical protein
MLKIMDFVEFGKDGPMSHCLRSAALWRYNHAMGRFEEWQAKSEQHQEWHLAEPISWLRRYFDQVTCSCADDKNTLGPRPPSSVLPNITDNEETTLREANEGIVSLYELCVDLINDYGMPPDLPLGPQNDPKDYLSRIDEEFREAIDGINSISTAGNATIQDLTAKSCGIWKETRRLMCDYREPLPFIIPSEAGLALGARAVYRGK